MQESVNSTGLAGFIESAPIIWAAGLFFMGAALSTILVVLAYRKKLGDSQKHADKLILDARKEAEIIKKEADIAAKDALIESKNKIEAELNQRKAEMSALEKRILQKEESLDKKFSSIEKKETEVSRLDEKLREETEKLRRKEKEVDALMEKQKTELLAVARLTEEEARNQVIRKLDEELEIEKAKKIKKAEAETKLIADRKARNIIVLAIQRQAIDQCQDHSTQMIQIPNDEMKGRIIGREGRNIRAFEKACGVDLIVDDTPDSILISCFDPVRRYIAKSTLDRLMQDGRIHPARIEDVVEKVRKETGGMIRDAAESVATELGLTGIHPEVMKLLGQLQFRTSYGQQQLKHSMEVAQLAGVLASELGVDQMIAKRAGLLHDIGKALTHEIEGSHAMIGADILKKYGESADVEHAVRAHHHDVEPRTVYAFITDAADAMSGGRPGARSKTEAAYIQRLEKLEEICMSFKGVERSFAIQAGRDLRVLVNPAEINDDQAVLLARSISRRIEDEVQFPGQIKISVVRELRAVDMAY